MSSVTDQVEQVRDATDLVALIGEYVKLEPKGREHVGLCPFHDDARPSFAVVTHKGTPFYKCFACGASGDCYRFLEKYLNWSFVQSLEHLAERAGITLERRGSRDREDGDRRQQRRQWLRSALDKADAWFRHTLNGEHGAAARQCIEHRGISADMVERFGLGAAPDAWNALQDALAGDDMPVKVLVGAQLLKEGDNGRVWDTFRNRLMFPIHDDAGQPIAFGGRDLGEDGPKYLNSPEHDLFKKHRTLYGIHLARKPMRNTNRAIVAEGYTDVIACHAAGFEETVGTLGTAFTDDHARILQRNVASVILLFDGDEAGRKAADRAVFTTLRHVLDVRICVLPDGIDPDDLLSQDNGKARFEAALADAVDAIDWMLERSGIAATPRGSAQRQQKLERLLGELGRTALDKVDPMRHDMLVARISECSGVAVSRVQQALKSGPDRKSRPADDVPEQPAAASPIERELLAVALAAISHRLPADAALESMTAPSLQAIAKAALDLLQAGQQVDVPHLHERLKDDALRALATELVESGHAILQSQTDAGEDLTGAVDRLFARLHRRRAEQQMDMKINDWRREGSDQPDSAAELVNAIRSAGRRPGALPRPIEG